MDVVWLKRDVRLHDHGPLNFVCTNPSKFPVCLLYLYEPDQLSEPTVHGSHIALVNEGLVDFDQQLSASVEGGITHRQVTTKGETNQYEFQHLTVCYGNAVPVLQHIHSTYTIRRLLAHEETGHYASYQRDRQVRKWCKENHVPFREFQQMGVTRRLQNRDDFSKKLQAFLGQPQYTVNVPQMKDRIRQLKLECQYSSEDDEKCNFWTTRHPLLSELKEIPPEHRVDRPSRQRGGEREGIKTLQTFLNERGEGYSSGVSSPLTSWTTCSRLSVFLAWGHLSLRHVHQLTKRRSEALKQQPDTGSFRKSLAAFQSRLHWRSHFIQKLESDPLLEKRDLHPSYQPLRRQPGDWNEAYYQAWATGNTGFPFVDACMRCLIQTGWINFRMRAMLVSFATYNLWLDWKRIAPHLARVFADYEPGIHYPQLQMQAGTTGINAMRVYNVIKQGKDQDAEGIFVKRYVPELQNVPQKYIHEPWTMPKATQLQCKVLVIREDKEDDSHSANGGMKFYPFKIVDAQESARLAKAKVHDIRKQETTKELAQEVYQKHGSRSRRDSNDERPKRKATPSPSKNQPSIQSFLTQQTSNKRSAATTTCQGSTETTARKEVSAKRKRISPSNQSTLQQSQDVGGTHSFWTCHACTYQNDKPLFLSCSMCGTKKKNAS